MYQAISPENQHNAEIAKAKILTKQHPNLLHNKNKNFINHNVEFTRSLNWEKRIYKIELG